MEKKKFIIYKISGNGFMYIGMSTQPLSTRFRQHKLDAKSEKCNITTKLCQKNPPKDLKALHRRLRDNASKYKIEKIKEVSGTYTMAHKEELSLKAKFSTIV